MLGRVSLSEPNLLHSELSWGRGRLSRFTAENPKLVGAATSCSRAAGDTALGRRPRTASIACPLDSHTAPHFRCPTARVNSASARFDRDRSTPVRFALFRLALGKEAPCGQIGTIAMRRRGT
jgi:hypothetical protein